MSIQRAVLFLLFSKWNLFPFIYFEQQKGLSLSHSIIQKFLMKWHLTLFHSNAQGHDGMPGASATSLASQTSTPWCVSTSTQKVASLKALKVESLPFNKKTVSTTCICGFKLVQHKISQQIGRFQTKDPTNCCLLKAMTSAAAVVFAANA